MFLYLLSAKSDEAVYEDDVNDDNEVDLENNGEMIYFSPCDDKGSSMFDAPGETFELCVCHVDRKKDCQKKRLVKPKRYASYVSSVFCIVMLLLFHSNIQSWQMHSLPTLDPCVFYLIAASSISEYMHGAW